tara:strand:- start:44 stop:1030 length:987 start_codon:yes stop_codon:yes gene_type:complete
MSISRRKFNHGLAATGLASAFAGIPSLSHAARTLVYANAGGPGTNSNNFAEAWLSEVSSQTGGELKFDYKLGTLGGEKDILDGVSLGTVDLYNGAYTGIPEFDAFYAPYFAKGSTHAKQVVDELLYDKLNGLLSSRYNVKFLGVGRAGPWKIYSNKKIESWSDLKGMKIRAPQIEGVVKGLEQLGAKPTVIPFNEVVPALKQGVVDGMTTLGSLGIPMKFYEVVKYIVRNDWGVGLDKQVISKPTWDSLGGKNQKILTDTLKSFEQRDYHEKTVSAEEGHLKQWEEFNGAGTVLELNGDEARKMLEPAIAKFTDDTFGKGTYDKIWSL